MYYFSCPSCTNRDRFYRVRHGEHRHRAGRLTWPFWGLRSLLFLRLDRRVRVQCANCGFVFQRPPCGQSSVATASMLLLYCIPLGVLFGYLAQTHPKLFLGFPGWAYVEQLGAFIADHPTGAALASVVSSGSILILACGFSIAGNWRARRRIRAEFEHEPTDFPPQPEVKKPTPTHCPACSYDLRGNESGKCPECGQNI
jgi:hypothetical protein